MIEAVIFDWAGTTVDFGSRAPMDAFVRLFKDEGMALSIAQARGPMGMNKWDHIHALLNLPEVQVQWQQLHGRPHEAADVDRLLAVFIPFNKISVVECSDLIPGMPSLSQSLRERHIKIGSTTGYTRELLDLVIPLAQQQGHEVDFSVCAGETEMGRPAPQMMQKCAAALGIDNPLSYIKVDDTLPGIDEGKAFGCWTVGVAISGNALGLSLEEMKAMPEAELAGLKQAARSALAAMKPDFVIDLVADLLPVLDQINQRLAAGQKPNSHDAH